jgi:hypothetical protein
VAHGNSSASGQRAQRTKPPSIDANATAAPKHINVPAVSGPGGGGRSEAAIRRRAEKRGRSVEEQRALDNAELQKREAKSITVAPLSRRPRPDADGKEASANRVSAGKPASAGPSNTAIAGPGAPAVKVGGRSEEALRRRAEKRGRTLEEQRALDAADAEKRAAKALAQDAPAANPGVGSDTEEGATPAPETKKARRAASLAEGAAGSEAAADSDEVAAPPRGWPGACSEVRMPGGRDARQLVLAMNTGAGHLCVLTGHVSSFPPY